MFQKKSLDVRKRNIITIQKMQTIESLKIPEKPSQLNSKTSVSGKIELIFKWIFVYETES